ncbi:1286_t:CDS:2 [Acaulospora morrowiae]|uniref:1286_t:CDS:1 n=1 Tax=Acaulospora morrowiae TaxID=94023 RepID=A0A9N9B9Y2_9GLOM|nr:1286_t:CDS:2 [Acaulospora morrowiae]
MEDTSRPDYFHYFQNTEPSKWSLVDFLTWRSEILRFLDRSKEHSVFKFFLHELTTDANITKAKRAQELLNNWNEIKFSPEVENFWNDNRTQNLLRQELQNVKAQNELKTLQIENEDLSYVLDRSKELNLHASMIGNRRKLMLEKIRDEQLQTKCVSGKVLRNASKRSQEEYSLDDDSEKGTKKNPKPCLESIYFTALRNDDDGSESNTELIDIDQGKAKIREIDAFYILMMIVFNF